ncbi:MAG TPA: threonylcarbamoyl-AMP synthase [Armatimonadetes bacterium]|nr:threonylcarbamoyl-AMP synthase [Armatimonadota bacterium]
MRKAPKVVKVEPGVLPSGVLKDAKSVLVVGGLVVYPTDTVYGLGANPLDERAVLRAFEAKRREAKPMPVLVSSLKVAEGLVEVTDEARKLMERFWPGGLTLVLPKKPTVPDVVTCSSPNLGVRMPNHPVALGLAESIGGYILGTSANISGRPAPRTAEEAIEQIGESVDLVIDAGPCPGGVPSTVIDLTARPPRVVRVGAVPIEEVSKVVEVA